MTLTNIKRRRLLMKLAQAQGNLCFHCDKPMVILEPDHTYSNNQNLAEQASYDHLFPKKDGGKGGFNFVIAHRQCNSVRGNKPPTEQELEKLSKLNEVRQHIFTEEHGQISVGTFGPITSSTIALTDVLNNLENNEVSVRIRNKTCRFLQLFTRDLNSLNEISNPDSWRYFMRLLRTDYITKLNDKDTLPKDIKDHVGLVISTYIKKKEENRP